MRTLHDLEIDADIMNDRMFDTMDLGNQQENSLDD